MAKKRPGWARWIIDMRLETEDGRGLRKKHIELTRERMAEIATGPHPPGRDFTTQLRDVADQLGRIMVHAYISEGAEAAGRDPERALEEFHIYEAGVRVGRAEAKAEAK